MLLANVAVTCLEPVAQSRCRARSTGPDFCFPQHLDRSAIFVRPSTSRGLLTKHHCGRWENLVQKPPTIRVSGGTAKGRKLKRPDVYLRPMMSKVIFSPLHTRHVLMHAHHHFCATYRTAFAHLEWNARAVGSLLPSFLAD